MSHHHDDPRLPPELEHRIFTSFMSSCMNENTNPTDLLLISKRIFEWLIPLYYEVVMILEDGSKPSTQIETALQKYGHHVRHLLITSLRSPSGQISGEDDNTTIKLLSSCPNVTNFGLWAANTYEDVNLIAKLPLTRLSIDIATFFRDDVNVHNPCSKITHLDLTTLEPWKPEEVLPYFKVLTHLAMYNGSKELSACLEHGTALKVIVLMTNGSHSFFEELERRGDEDARVARICVGFNLEDCWRDGAFGGGDMWVFADEMMERRRTSAKT